MSPTAALQPLRQQLSTLYDDRGRLRILLDDIGLDAARIDLNGALNAVWQSVLREADRQALVAALVAYATADYPARTAALAAAYEPYRQATAAALPADAVTTSTNHQEERSMPPDPALPYDVFLSYSHRDATWVRSVLLPKLEANGLRVCIDVRDFALGAPLITEIERAVSQSRKTLLVLTPDYLASEWAEFENILVATLDPAARARRLLPLLLKPADLPLRIRALNYLDFSQGAEEAFLWQRLVAALRTDAAPATPVTTATPTATPANPPVNPAESDRLRRTLTMAQRTLTILEEQAAAYTALSIPAHLRIELEEKRSEVARLAAQLQALGG